MHFAKPRGVYGGEKTEIEEHLNLFYSKKMRFLTQEQYSAKRDCKAAKAH